MAKVAKKAKKGVKHYLIPAQHYRKGRLYEAGEVVKNVPEDEKPGKGWVEVDASGEPINPPEEELDETEEGDDEVEAEEKPAKASQKAPAAPKSAKPAKAAKKPAKAPKAEEAAEEPEGESDTEQDI